MPARSRPGSRMSLPFRRTDPESGASSPARRELKVVFPAPANPTMATHSPLSIVRSMPPRTSVRRSGGPKPLRIPLSSRKAMASRRLEPGFDHAHHPVEDEADDADRADAENDVLVDQAVGLLPEEAAHAGRAGEHFDGADTQPRHAEAEAEAGDDVGRRRVHRPL